MRKKTLRAAEYPGKHKLWREHVNPWTCPHCGNVKEYAYKSIAPQNAVGYRGDVFTCVEMAVGLCPRSKCTMCGSVIIPRPPHYA